MRKVLTQEVEIDIRPPPPPPAPVDPPTPELPTPAAKPKAVARAASRAAPKAAAAQAGAVLAAAEDVVDFTDEIVTGNAGRYAGGLTVSGGTSAVAVHDNVGGPGTARMAVEVDRSRPPELAQGAEWKCPFPRSADEAGVDGAFVTLEVAVDPRGRVTHVKILDDPGYGFAREAELCAYEKRWAPGLDRRGQPKQETALVRVRFIR